MDIKIVCKFCQGTKKLYGEGTCPFCLGRGNETVLLPEDGFYNAVDISEIIVFSEYDLLTKKQQEHLAVIIEAGYVNLKEGSTEREMLREFFPAGTQTNRKISELLGESL